MIKLSLPATIASLLGKRDHEGYVDVKQKMNIQDLYQIMGLSNSPMLYNYMSGKTKDIAPERALVIYEKFNVLIDLWDSPENLKADAVNTDLSHQIAREPVKVIMEELIKIEANATDYIPLRRGVRKLIARYY